MRIQTSLAIVLLAACGGGGSAQTDAPPGGGTDGKPGDGTQSDGPHPDAAIDAMVDAMVDAPGTGADAAPTGMYMGPTDGNRCSEDMWCPVEPAIPVGGS